MFESVSIAASGLYSQQKRLDTIANNVSNVNTIGYKGNRLEFDEAMYTATQGGLKGHGVTVASTNKSFAQGALIETDSDLDFAIEGEGFFEIVDDKGNTLYTRAGNFYLSAEGEETYLVTADGYRVQSREGQAITIPEGTASVSVSADGQLLFLDEEGETLDTAQFGIYTFNNKYGLEAVGENNYQATVASGGRQEAEDAKIHQRALESSNVDLSEEMVNLIRAQRTFSLVSRALTTADDMEGIANNLKR